MVTEIINIYGHQRARLLDAISGAEDAGDNRQVDDCLREMVRLASWRADQHTRHIAQAIEQEFEVTDEVLQTWDTILP